MMRRRRKAPGGGVVVVGVAVAVGGTWRTASAKEAAPWRRAGRPERTAAVECGTRAPGGRERRSSVVGREEALAREALAHAQRAAIVAGQASVGMMAS